MLPMIISGIFLVGLLFADNLRESSEPWNNREEHRHFHESRKQWMHEGWMVYH